MHLIFFDFSIANHVLRGCVVTVVLPLYVISSETRNLLLLSTCGFKIPRLTPQNVIATQPLWAWILPHHSGSTVSFQLKDWGV